MDNTPIIIDPIKEAIADAIKNLKLANELASNRATNEDLLRENKEMFREIDALNLRNDMLLNQNEELDNKVRNYEYKIFSLDATIKELQERNEALIKRISKYE
jgi:cell division protein FtsB